MNFLGTSFRVNAGLRTQLAELLGGCRRRNLPWADRSTAFKRNEFPG
jgi:hypothetical protein